MAKTASNMLDLGTLAPDFDLPDTEGRRVSRESLLKAQGCQGLLVVFMCNHCPYVVHIADRLAALTRDWMSRGLAVVGINANDPDEYPEDAPEAMAREKARRGYVFPYLFDQSQQVAQAYRAACTPDIFLFDAAGRLVYRGQFDGSRPGSQTPVTGEDLERAVDCLMTQRPISTAQKPSLGCNIKWRVGNEPRPQAAP